MHVSFSEMINLEAFSAFLYCLTLLHPFFKVIIKEHRRWIILCYIVTDDLFGGYVMTISLFFNDGLLDG